MWTQSFKCTLNTFARSAKINSAAWKSKTNENVVVSIFSLFNCLNGNNCNNFRQMFSFIHSFISTRTKIELLPFLTEYSHIYSAMFTYYCFNCHLTFSHASYSHSPPPPQWMNQHTNTQLLGVDVFILLITPHNYKKKNKTQPNKKRGERATWNGQTKRTHQFIAYTLQWR